MILPVHQRLRAAIAARLTEIYGLAPADQPSIAIDYAPNRALGDLAVPVAFELARRLRKPPRAIAQELAAALGQVEGFSRIEATPSGYLNCFLDRAAFLHHPSAAATLRRAGRLTRARPSSSTPPSTRTRRRTSATSATRPSATRSSACCGSGAGPSKCRTTSTTRASRSPTSWSGSRRSSRSRSSRCARSRRAPRFDYYCWDLYARVTEWYEADKTRLAVRQTALHDIEHGGNPTAEMGALVADAIVRCHLETMRRLHIGYDLLTWEGDILRLKFWAHAFEILKQQGTVYFQTEGRLAGCWVMAIDDGESGEPGVVGRAG